MRDNNHVIYNQISILSVKNPENYVSTLNVGPLFSKITYSSSPPTHLTAKPRDKKTTKEMHIKSEI